MSDGLRDLYQELILDHGKRPRNFKKLQSSSHQAEGFNPLCGDKVELQVLIEDGLIREMAFQGTGCAISTASASMMTEILKGRTLEQAERIFNDFHALITGSESEAAAAEARLGKLSVFSGVREFPTRIKCAILVWHTLKAALEREVRPVTTEAV